MTRGLPESNVAGNPRLEELRPKERRQIGTNLSRECRPLVEHGDHHTLDLQARILLPPNLPNRPHELRNALEREVFALNGNKHAVRGNQRVDRQQVQRRWAVDQNVVKILGNRLKGARHPLVAIFRGGQLECHPDEVAACRRQQEPPHLGGNDDVGQRLPVDHRVVRRPLDALFADPEPRRRVRLRVQVDHECPHLCSGQRSRQIDRRRRFPNPALLVGNCDDARHWPFSLGGQRPVVFHVEHPVRLRNPPPSPILS